MKMNKNLNFYLKLNYSYRITPDPELGYFIEIPELPGCWGDGKTVDKAIADVEETKREWLKIAIKKGREIPLPREDTDYSGQFLLRMPKSLHKAVAEEAQWEGVSINHYLVTLITENRHIKTVFGLQKVNSKKHLAQ